MMNLVIIFLALLLGATLQQVLPGLAPLGMAKAPIVLSIMLYYALERSLGLTITAAIVGGLICDSLEALPIGYSSLVFCALGIGARCCRDFVFSARRVTLMAFGFMAGLGLAFGLYILLYFSEQNLREASFIGICFKAVGTAILGMILTPIVFVIMERMDRLMGNTILEPSHES